MSVEISKELKDKLKIIEAETEFFSQKPVKPRMSKLSVWSMGICILIAAWVGFDSGSLILPFLLLLSVAINLFHYGYSKQLFDSYSSACEIISYYKNLDEKQI